MKKYTLCKKIRDLEPYEPINGKYEIRLDANESFIDAGIERADLIKNALNNVRFNRYPDPCAIKVCRAFGSLYGIDPKYITAGNGSDELISIITGAFAQKGDKILTVSPDFSMYSFYSELVELDSSVIAKDSNLNICADCIIEAANRENAKMIILSNPCNPTSNGMKKDEVRKLVSSVDSLVIIDEAYMDFWNESILSEAHEYENLIVLRTCSKALGLAALRLGFAISCEKISKAIKAVKSPYNVNSLSQEIGTALLSDKEYIEDALERIIISRDSLYDSLKKLSETKKDIIKIYEPKTNFVFMEVKENMSVFEKLKECGIVVRAFPGMLRISAGAEHENSALISALEDILK